MILGTDEILSRLNKGEIFRKESWDWKCVKEASYALRVAGDGMIIGEDIIDPDDTSNSRSEITIHPGRIAVLSTEERLCMPSDLVGKLGVRLKFASKGLVGQMGIQVDPFYGQGENKEVRLYIKVANLGNNDVMIRRGDAVFNIEFSRVEGARLPSEEKVDTWKRILKTVGDPNYQDWTYMTRINENLDTKADEINKVVAEKTQELNDDLIRRLGWIRDNQQAVVMFGVFLVAITILTVMVGAILNVESAPSWVVGTGWIVLLVLCVIATGAIVGFLILIGILLWRTFGRSEQDTQNRSG